MARAVGTSHLLIPPWLAKRRGETPLSLKTHEEKQMNEDVNFEDILDTQADTVEKPKPMPQGSYVGLIVSHELGKSAKKQTPYVRYMVRPVEPMDDVDTELLEEVTNWQQKTLRLDFYLTPDSLFRLTNFFEQLGIDTAGRSVRELIPECINEQIVIAVGHDIAGEDVFANITSTAAIE
jgi:hypothetical protein